MTDLEVGRVASPPIEPVTSRERLRLAANEFEGVFVAQLFREMRATVPTEDDAGQDQDLFISMLDDTLAREMAGKTTRGLGDALYRQLVTRLGNPARANEGVASRGE